MHLLPAYLFNLQPNVKKYSHVDMKTMLCVALKQFPMTFSNFRWTLEQNETNVVTIYFWYWKCRYSGESCHSVARIFSILNCNLWL